MTSNFLCFVLRSMLSNLRDHTKVGVFGGRKPCWHPRQHMEGFEGDPVDSITNHKNEYFAFCWESESQKYLSPANRNLPTELLAFPVFLNKGKHGFADPNLRSNIFPIFSKGSHKKAMK